MIELSSGHPCVSYSAHVERDSKQRHRHCSWHIIIMHWHWKCTETHSHTIRQIIHLDYGFSLMLNIFAICNVFFYSNFMNELNKKKVYYYCTNWHLSSYNQYTEHTKKLSMRLSVCLWSCGAWNILRILLKGNRFAFFFSLKIVANLQILHIQL